MKTTKIYVGNLPQSASNEEIQGLFEKYGSVKECDVVRNYAFVHMDSEEEAKVAIDNLQGYDYNGQKLSVEISHSKVRQRPGMGGKGQCYRCGRSGHWSKECPRNPATRMGGNRGMNGNGGPMYPTAVMYPTRYDAYSRYSVMERQYPMERGYADRGYSERMRPYPDPYERRPMAPPQDTYMYYRRPYESFAYTRRSPPPQIPPVSRYDFSQDTSFQSAGPVARHAPVY